MKCEHCNNPNSDSKKFCIWCGKHVKHTDHYIWLKRVLNKAVKLNKDDLELGNFNKYSDEIFVKVNYRDVEYHIKASTVLLYFNNDYTKDTMDMLQQGVIKIKRYMKEKKSPDI